MKQQTNKTTGTKYVGTNDCGGGRDVAIFVGSDTVGSSDTTDDHTLNSVLLYTNENEKGKKFAALAESKLKLFDRYAWLLLLIVVHVCSIANKRSRERTTRNRAEVSER